MTSACRRVAHAFTGTAPSVPHANPQHLSSFPAFKPGHSENILYFVDSVSAEHPSILATYLNLLRLFP